MESQRRWRREERLTSATWTCAKHWMLPTSHPCLQIGETGFGGWTTQGDKELSAPGAHCPCGGRAVNQGCSSGSGLTLFDIFHGDTDWGIQAPSPGVPGHQGGWCWREGKHPEGAGQPGVTACTCALSP